MCILAFVANVTPVGSKHSFSRFGPGIYTSACSSSKALSLPSVPGDCATNRTTEADDYSKDLEPYMVRSRALLLNAVVHGNPQKLAYTDASLSSLKSGCHSVGIFGVHDSGLFG